MTVVRLAVIPVPRHWDDKKRSTGMTAIYVIPRFIRGISAANKQRDDGCRLAINIKKFTK
ncbi:hypothetical protein [Wolbachia endosymbiont (group A) of Gymnosoma rotundatum]|uniref:hypothetical protein n=1 Tax=Wolbachia endosymbiont (group A) of Gymnosoma rotundatum TaxID=2954016 RepID=UPI0022268DA7|nr:hypothetical protein [Wolbachia endosymbiont (group A) of Gymnosoma rotundatum]